jgi:hypothetical protein
MLVSYQLQSMRILLLITFLLATHLQAADVRTINNRAVDLQPIHDWKAGDQTTERPLKHWKELKVLEIQQQISTTMHVATVEIDGTRQAIILRNMPKDQREKATRLGTLKSQVTAAEKASANASAVAAAAKVRASGSAGVYVTDDTAYLDAVRADELRKKDEAAAAEGRSVIAAANLKALKDEIASLEDYLRKNPLLAMANGASYAGKPEWDTGMR